MKYYIEIAVSDHAYETGDGRWANYGTIIAEGNTLDELLDKAIVDIMDQNGGELRCSPMPADSSWMQKLIEDEFNERNVE